MGCSYVTAINIGARPHPQENWQDSLVQKGTSVSPHPIKKSDCHTLAKARNHVSSLNNKSEPKPNVSAFDNGHLNPNGDNKDFEPRPNISIYDNDTGLKGKKNSDEEFEPRPNISVYDNATGLKGRKNSDEEFEPRPNISVYDNDTGLKGKKNSNEDFELRPNISVYNNDAGFKGKKTLNGEFEPRPNISVYDNDIDLKDKKTSKEEFEPRPNISVYDNDTVAEFIHIPQGCNWIAIFCLAPNLIAELNWFICCNWITTKIKMTDSKDHRRRVDYFSAKLTEDFQEFCCSTEPNIQQLVLRDHDEKPVIGIGMKMHSFSWKQYTGC
ncbi:hypothetical protein L1987_38112 [Smallanthus sonchifolius]|uniref:Uncharacterized protein n=1 Tax=Smallanthus sonchifolius TaxID=185202 RepID=A0ACB9HI56_9ASTR|nr:hypothetical protein L1987_38112 [Smallanthus sonchifolius]